MPTTPGTDFNDMLQREGGPTIVKLIENAISGQDNANAQATTQAPETGRHLPIGFVEPSHPLPSLSSIDGNLRHSTRRAWSLLIASNRSPWIFRLGGQPTWVVPDDEGRPAAATIDINNNHNNVPDNDNEDGDEAGENDPDELTGIAVEMITCLAAADKEGPPMRRPLKERGHRSHPRRGKGEKANQKPMASVGAVYSIDRFPQSAADVVDQV